MDSLIRLGGMGWAESCSVEAVSAGLEMCSIGSFLGGRRVAWMVEWFLLFG